ncbi:UbiX family flavin prenyltransferase [Neomoorella humiferrea]|uniref:UbiX family flavin prenyltransferase n=1 Tax=Neomoorella humiferrea TaxID=676965 RepID=UPI003D922E42
MKKTKIVVGMSGATGQIYGIRLIEELKALGAEIHLVMSEWAKKTILMETDYEPEEIESLADYAYENYNVGAAIASGSFRHQGMVIAPCSIKTLSGIANSWNDNLLIRAADVTLKEHRPLILVVRETPLHRGHIELMLKADMMGATILPPLPAFYNHPATINDLVNHTVGRILDHLGFEQKLAAEWQGKGVPLRKDNLRAI